MKIFLDMDGVLVDFVKGACSAHRRPPLYETDPAALGVFDMEKLWGISVNTFYAALNYEGFWRDLKPMPEANELVQMATEAVGIDNVAVLSSPNLDPRCPGEKREWLVKHFPQLAPRLILARSPVKCMVASPQHILIDDYDRNIDQWRLAKGVGILVPRPWNRMHSLSGDVVKYVQAGLRDAGMRSSQNA